MKIQSEQKLRGKFWLPEHAEDQIEHLDGTLTLTRSGRAVLDLDLPDRYRTALTFEDEERSSFLGIPYHASQRIDTLVCGRLHDGRYVALEGCGYSYEPILRSHTLGAFVNLSERVWPTRALLRQEPLEESPSLTGMNVTIEGLDTWLDVRGIETEPLVWFRECTFSVSKSAAALPRVEVVSRGIKFHLSCGFSWEGSASNTHEVVIRQRPVLRIEAVEEQGVAVGDFVRVAEVFQRFLWFVTNRPMRLLSLSGRDGEKVFKPEWTPSRPEDEPDVTWIDMLFLAKDIGRREESVIGSWFEYYDRHEWLVDLYLSLCCGRHLVRHSLVDAVQCLESLASRDKEDSEARRLYDKVLSSCSGETKAWMRMKAWLCKQSRRRAIEDLLRPYRDVVDEPGDLVRELWECRSRLVHGGSWGGNDARSLAGKAVALVRVILLAKLGFGQREIVLMVASNVHVWGWLYVSSDGDQTNEANEELRQLRSSLSHRAG